MQKSHLIIALVCLLAGFAIALYFDQDKTVDTPSSEDTLLSSNDNNPFQTEQKTVFVFDESTLENSTLNDEIARINHRLTLLEEKLESLDSTPDTLASRTKRQEMLIASSLNRRLYNIKNLIRGGIDPGVAEDIVRRKNSIELKRLELQDRAKRDDYLNTQRYYDELDQINSQDTTLREELGEDAYDQYLYTSKQNNRIRISSVMLGSAAEQAGIQNNDIVLSYDNNRMFTWQELKQATTEGELGEYVSISIYRKGEIFSFSVPRGPLGMQLGATRLEP